MEYAAVAAAVLLLGSFWVAATRRHHRRRVRDAEWDTTERPGLWTSSAACPNCGRGGAVLSADEEDPDGPLRFSCLSCGHEHRRRTPG